MLSLKTTIDPPPPPLPPTVVKGGGGQKVHYGQFYLTKRHFYLNVYTDGKTEKTINNVKIV